jgi:UDP-N-acetyl-D-mannosaminuronic acid dehydrogenase
VKIAVVGTGRVGLPLALAFAESGEEVVGVEIDPALRRAVNEERRMPFLEPGFDATLAEGRLTLVADMDEVRDADYYVVTVGTPLLPHIETDLSAVTRVIVQIATFIGPGQCVVMRSTTAPRTTDYVRRLLESRSGRKVGEDLLLACCPERIVEGKAREELFRLPQIVGAEDPASAAAAARLFGLLGVEVLPCDFITAELVKLFNNVSRYSYFAVVNALAMIAMEYGAEPYEVLRLTNHEYPRPVQHKPGFSAGTCLRKDFGMISEAYWNTDLLVQAWRVNESLPKFLVDRVKDRWGGMEASRIAVLGYTFKRDADDVRDTLSLKLLRYLHRECPRALVVQDPHIGGDKVEPLHDVGFTTELDEAVSASDLIFIATNHTQYTEAREALLARVRAGDCRIVDIWNALGTGHVFVDREALT